MNADSEDPRLPVPFDVRLVAKIALSVAAASFAGLLLVLFIVTDDRGVSYGALIGAIDLTREQLKPALLIFGLLMVVFAGITAWVFSLYTSFRVAGPLYRISRSLETSIDRGPVTPVPIRETDQLQHEWRQFEASVAALRDQHATLWRALEDCEAALRAHAESPISPARAIAALKQAEQRVQL